MSNVSMPETQVLIVVSWEGTMTRFRAGIIQWGGARLTPYGTQDKLDTGILLPRQVQANSNRCLRHHDSPEMMHSADMTRFSKSASFSLTSLLAAEMQVPGRVSL